jgi:hypothetical protein
MKGDVKNKLRLTWLLNHFLGSQPRSAWSYRVAPHLPCLVKVTLPVSMCSTKLCHGLTGG